MRKPEQTTEPSIEEILASIRRIIADEGSPAAPVFDQAVPDLAQVHNLQQGRYDERHDERYQDDTGYDDRGYDANGYQAQPVRGPRHDEHGYDEPQGRVAPFDGRGRDEPRRRDPRYDDALREGPQARDPRYDERRFDEPQARGQHYDEPRYDGPRGREHPQHDQQGRDLRQEPPRRDLRPEFPPREPVRDDFDYDDNDSRHDYRGSERSANGYNGDADFRDDFHAAEHGSAAFDPYATHDDYDAKPRRANGGSEDEILELTEDFMVEETAAVDGDDRETAAREEADFAGLAMNFAATDFGHGSPFENDVSAPAPFADFDTDDAKPQAEATAKVTAIPTPLTAIAPEAAPIAANAAPELDFASDGLEGVLSNVVAEMKRLSEGQGLDALKDANAPRTESKGEPPLIPFGEPEMQPQSWQPRARQASSAPQQRPVWSARHRDGDSKTQQREPAPTSGLARDRSKSGGVSAADANPGAPFGELAPKTVGGNTGSQKSAKSDATGAQTALARSAGLKTEVEEVMPDLPDGDFPSESGGASGASKGKPTVAAELAAREKLGAGSVSTEETPELPSVEDDEPAAQGSSAPVAKAAAPAAVSAWKPQSTTAAVPTPAKAKAEASPAVPATPVAPAKADTPPAAATPAAPMPAAPAIVAKPASEKVGATALPSSLEDGVKDMLKPLVAEWLKDNLPRLVDEVLREEIRKNGPLGKSGKD